MNNRLPLVVLCCLGWLTPVFVGQDPKPTPAKLPIEKPAIEKPPIQEPAEQPPAETSVAPPQEGSKEEGKRPPDAAQPTRHPFEGVYELRRRMVAGAIDPRTGSGYAAITSRHLFLCILGPGVNASRPLLRADVRGWKPIDNGIQTEVKLSYFNDADGNVIVARPGERATRRVDLARGLLRIYQDDLSYLEFERVE